MGIKTQGLQVWYVCEKTGVVHKLGCPTSLNLGEQSVDKIDVTCLDERDEKRYEEGLADSPEAQIGINFDPNESSHETLYQESEKNPRELLEIAIGWSDGYAAPTYTKATKKWTLPNTRSWCNFQATVSTFPFSFEANNVVKTNIKLTRKSSVKFTKKSA